MPNNDYIKRVDAKKAIFEWCRETADIRSWYEVIDEVPAAEVAEVTHGRWIERDLDNFRKYECACSECGARYIGNYDQYCEPAEFSYCPNCGAKMDKEEV